ncbi:Phospholipid N-methyltransferase [Geodermatophilus saharensis]|uniref:Phospholipid N-methyltransferase n=1 Tax=Geodermatophilus saharensis TaxID=1137994 RepID=A0A239CMS7_9ACTN|nr:methyltransferase domain-containing protein [Geodermatophilus saharensis]SNS20991.1 Phospholipid N-methyltransferase [Geodermatophilus saharensis]
MTDALGDGLRLLRAFASNPRQIGAVLPTSRTAVRAMLDLADVPAAGLVVELGAGTGVATREILARLGPAARLVAVEIEPRLARLLTERFGDPRLQVVCGSAEDLDAHLDGDRADVVVSMLPFTSLEAGLRRRLLDVLPRALRPGGTALVIQYSPLVRGELRRRFAAVRTVVTPWNVPPAFLFACTGPGAAAAGR